MGICNPHGIAARLCRFACRRNSAELQLMYIASHDVLKLLVRYLANWPFSLFLLGT